MKILITGANGQLGRALQHLFPDAVTGDVDSIDITDITSIEAAMDDSVAAIINAAAYTNVDTAEDPANFARVWHVNTQGVANLAQVAAQKDIPLVHISTDYVFDGTKNGEYLEGDIPHPLSVYGSSKYASEHAASFARKHYIIRTSWVIGDGHNFVQTMLSLARKHINPSVVNDQIGRPTFTPTLAKGIKHLLESKADSGTYHLTNSGRSVSWADFAREIFHQARIEAIVTDVSTDEYFKDKPLHAHRPSNSMLSLKKIQTAGFTPNDWKVELRKYIKECI